MTLFGWTFGAGFFGVLVGLATTFVALAALDGGLIELTTGGFPMILAFFGLGLDFGALFSVFRTVATPAFGFPFVLTFASRDAATFLLFASVFAVGWFFFEAFKANS